MSHFLLPSTPIYGHVMPMLAIGRGLAARGHRVTVLTGRKYAGAVAAYGLSFLPLPSEVDYDDADLENWLPNRHKYSGIAAGRYDVLGLFIRPLRAQHDSVLRALATDHYDGIVCEASFLGVMPLLLGVPPGQRIPIVGVSATPMTLTSVDCAPFGSGLDPGDSPFSRLRNRQINFLLHRGPLRSLHATLEATLVELGVPRARTNYFDQASRFDVTFQLAVAGIEYPRRELPPTVRFVGPLRTPLPTHTRLPQWWADLSGPQPVVHVTQGTLDNADPAKLLVPALRGLARENVLVVASTGGRPVDSVVAAYGGPLPENARVAEFIPYDRLLPQTDVVVTNGGYGGVQRALFYGLPIVVAGSTEDKPEVAARVAWSGSGINLRTGKPSPGRLRTAVLTALRDPRYRLAAQRLQREIAAQGDPLATIMTTLERLTATPHQVEATPTRGADRPSLAYDRSNLGAF
ncbi:MAG TPA: nucleotide disphospho-sugar-binding domain-containing protein [Propionibacteriaceae bacterium]